MVGFFFPRLATHGLGKMAGLDGGIAVAGEEIVGPPHAGHLLGKLVGEALRLIGPWPQLTALQARNNRPKNEDIWNPPWALSRKIISFRSRRLHVSILCPFFVCPFY